MKRLAICVLLFLSVAGFCVVVAHQMRSASLAQVARQQAATRDMVDHHGVDVAIQDLIQSESLQGREWAPLRRSLAKLIPHLPITPTVRVAKSPTTGLEEEYERYCDDREVLLEFVAAVEKILFSEQNIDAATIHLYHRALLCIAEKSKDPYSSLSAANILGLRFMPWKDKEIVSPSNPPPADLVFAAYHAGFELLKSPDVELEHPALVFGMAMTGPMAVQYYIQCRLYACPSDDPAVIRAEAKRAIDELHQVFREAVQKVPFENRRNAMTFVEDLLKGMVSEEVLSRTPDEILRYRAFQAWAPEFVAAINADDYNRYTKLIHPDNRRDSFASHWESASFKQAVFPDAKTIVLRDTYLYQFEIECQQQNGESHFYTVRAILEKIDGDWVCMENEFDRKKIQR